MQNIEVRNLDDVSDDEGNAQKKELKGADSSNSDQSTGNTGKKKNSRF